MKYLKLFESFDSYEVNEIINEFIDDNNLIEVGGSREIIDDIIYGRIKDIYYILDNSFSTRSTILLMILYPKIFTNGLFRKKHPKLKKIEDEIQIMSNRIKSMGLKFSIQNDKFRNVECKYINIGETVSLDDFNNKII